MKKKSYTKYFIAAFVICFALLMIPGIGGIVENRAIEKEKDRYGQTDHLMYLGYYNMKLETDYAIERLESMKKGNRLDTRKFIEEYGEINTRLLYEIRPFTSIYLTDTSRYYDFYPVVLDDYIYAIGLDSKDFVDMSYSELIKYYDSMLTVYKAWSETSWPKLGDYMGYDMSEDPADFKGKVEKINKIAKAESEKLELYKS